MERVVYSLNFPAQPVSMRARLIADAYTVYFNATVTATVIAIYFTYPTRLIMTRTPTTLVNKYSRSTCINALGSTA